MSACGHKMDMTPFCPCRDENLSPMMGLRGKRRVMPTRLRGSLAFLVPCFPPPPLESTPPRALTHCTKHASDSLCLIGWGSPVRSSITQQIGSPSCMKSPMCGNPSSSKDSKTLTCSSSPASLPAGLALPGDAASGCSALRCLYLPSLDFCVWFPNRRSPPTAAPGPAVRFFSSARSTTLVLYTEAWAKPRSYDDLFRIIASSMS
mmetsp:Transcript_53616/g.122270  ORF Transcript_53616/g.122270 Transcript_53616/m.122270 type:complete len:205 (+) Transcript_53616:881-1495(+)